jgi:F-type H+-transporting ATPase subunit epsilon
MALQLKIVTPTRVIVDTEVSELTAPGAAGEFGVLPEHVTFLAKVDTGVVTWVEGGATRKLVISGGYAEVVDDIVTILADEAEFPNEIDPAAARSELSRLEGELKEPHETAEEVDSLLAAYRRAESRVAAVS